MKSPSGGEALRPDRALALALITVAAACLRVADAFWRPFIPGKLWAPDEGTSVELAQLPWGELVAQAAADTHPPLYYGLVKLWYMVTPETLMSARAMSAVFSAATIPLIFGLARRVAGEKAAWLAVLFTAVAPYQVYWGHLARMHAVQPFFILLIVWFSWRFLEEGHWRDWLWVVVAWSLALWTNYMALVFGVIWGLAFLAFTAASWKRRLMLMPAGLAGLASFLPWFIVLSRQVEEGPMNRNFFQETVSPVYLYFHSIFGVMEPYQPPVPFLLLLPAMLFFAAVLVAGIRPIGRCWPLWVLVLAGPALPIVLAILGKWTLAERHLLFAIPYFMIWWGAGLAELVPAFRRRFLEKRKAPP